MKYWKGFSKLKRERERKEKKNQDLGKHNWKAITQMTQDADLKIQRFKKNTSKIIKCPQGK